METDTYSSAIAAKPVLQEPLIALKTARVLDAKQVIDVVIGATRKLNATKDPDV